MKSANAVLPGTAGPPTSIVTSGVSPCWAKAACAAAHSEASTKVKVGSLRPIRYAITSVASSGLSGTQVIPALAIPILVR